MILLELLLLDELALRAASSAASLTRLARSAPVKPGVPPRACRARYRLPAACPSCAPRGSAAADAVGPITDDLAVEAARAQQCRVEDVGPVGGRDEDDVVLQLEVHLDQQLVSVCSRSSWPPPRLAPRWRPTASISSMKTMHGDACLPARTGRARGWHRRRRTSRRSRSRDGEERHARLARHCAREQRLARAREGSSSTPLGMRAPSAWNFFGSRGTP